MTLNTKTLGDGLPAYVITDDVQIRVRKIGQQHLSRGHAMDISIHAEGYMVDSSGNEISGPKGSTSLTMHNGVPPDGQTMEDIKAELVNMCIVDFTNKFKMAQVAAIPDGQLL